MMNTNLPEALTLVTRPPSQRFDRFTLGAGEREGVDAYLLQFVDHFPSLGGAVVGAGQQAVGFDPGSHEGSGAVELALGAAGYAAPVELECGAVLAGGHLNPVARGMRGGRWRLGPDLFARDGDARNVDRAGRRRRRSRRREREAVEGIFDRCARRCARAGGARSQ